jgi:hypothetical protein
MTVTISQSCFGATKTFFYLTAEAFTNYFLAF